MKIGKVKINNFRSILETEFNLPQGVAALAGGNESGKSNVLLALAKFLNLTDFDDSDKYQLSDVGPSMEITFTSFTPKELGKLKKLLNREEIDNLVVKRTDNSYEIISPVIEELTEEEEQEEQQLNEEDEDENIAADEVSQADEGVPESVTDESPKSLSKKEIQEEVIKLIPDAELIRSVESLIEGGNILINEIFAGEVRKEKMSKEKLEKMKTVRSLLEIGEITKKDVREKDLTKRTLILQKGAARAAKKLRASWTQEDVKMKIIADQKYLVICFRDGKNRPKDKEDDTKWIWTLPEDRSTGFRWYVTFYVRYLTQLEKSKNVVFLIDDAGASLNKIAQEDLLKEFSKYANERTNAQIVYATHSKYMVKWDFRNNIRLARKDAGRGTKIIEMWWGKYSPNELPSPLNELGVSWSDDFLEHDNLIVEGYSDVYLLHHLPGKFAEEVSQDPYHGFKVLHAGAASLEVELGKLCKANRKRAFLFFDSDGPGQKYKGDAEEIKEDEKLDCEEIKGLIEENISYNVVTIEDLLPRERYIEALNPMGGKHFGDTWQKISRLQQVDNLGIGKATNLRLKQMGIVREERKSFIRTSKYNILKQAVNLTSKKDYNESQLKAVVSFFSNLKKRLEALTTSE